MGGGSGKSSSTTTTSPYAPALWAMASQRNRATMPVLNELSAETQNALQTGGVNSGEPLINRQTDAAREASSQGMETTRQNLARAGLSGTSFAQAILGTQNQSNAGNIANIGPNVASSFIAGAPNIGLNASGLSTAASAAGLDTTTTATPSSWSDFISTLSNTEGLFVGPGPLNNAFPNSSNTAGATPPGGTPTTSEEQGIAGSTTGMGSEAFAGSTFAGGSSTPWWDIFAAG